MCVGFITGTPKGSPKVVLWRSRQSNNDPWLTRHSTYPLHLFCGFPGCKPVPTGWFKIVCWFYVGNTQRLTESGFMEKAGIEHATPGLQGIALIPYTFFCGFPGYKPVPLGWFKICVLVILREHPKAHQKWFYREAGNQTCHPWLTRQSTYPLHLFCGFPVYKPVTLGWFKICVLFLIQEHPKAHRKWFYGEAGNQICNSWFTRHSTYPLHLFCGFPGYKPVPPGWFKVCVGFITGTPKGSRKVGLWRSQVSNLPPLVYKV